MPTHTPNARARVPVGVLFPDVKVGRAETGDLRQRGHAEHLVLRRQLLALSPDQLSNVILAYGLGDPVSDLSSVAELSRRVDEIVAVIRDRARAA